MSAIFWYFVNVTGIALPVALFEIWLEKFKSGFGGEFYSPFWGRHINLGFLLRVFEKSHITVYHLAYALFLAAILAAEYAILRRKSFRHGLVLEIGNMKIVPFLFFPAVWIGVATLEDFLWFALNWKYPDALSRLLRGEMAWHTNWVTLPNGMLLPSFYITVPFLVMVLFLTQSLIIRLRR